MKIEMQVCSLVLAKKLKELNCPQESLFYWAMYSSEAGGNGNSFLLFEDEFERKKYDLIFPYSAFTVAELGEMLPDWYVSYHFEKRWYVEKNIRGKRTPYLKSFDTEADARAKMLIYLIENNLMEIPK